jgi:sodium-independent sulfate anion transporter 11
VITAVVVLLAIYALPAVFFYIPNAALSGVIIHAVLDLITPPNTVYQFWRVSPLEVPIFFAGVLVTIFSNIENGIYTTIIASACLLLFRLIKASGRFLGKVKIHSHSGQNIIGENQPLLSAPDSAYDTSGTTDGDVNARNVFLPIDHEDGSNPQIDVQIPQPGIIIYRFSEGFNYPNASHYLDQLTTHIFATTRRTNPNHYARPGDRPWNDPGPRRGKAPELHPDRPTLKAIILDFSSVNHVDITSVQQMIDVRNQLDKYVSPSVVDWHFASLNNRWTKRALVSAGFGYPTMPDPSGARWKPIFSLAEIGDSGHATRVAKHDDPEKQATELLPHRMNYHGTDVAHENRRIPHDARSRTTSNDSGSGGTKEANDTLNAQQVRARGVYGRTAVVTGLNRPLFHVDLTSALQSAVANVQERELREAETASGVEADV